ncbi:MAG TPA: hypothetical protein VHT03_00910 [Rhizomicrobium sp.]|jgi:hypothetical protein|nr:hypothetical protein [Rhizomicrobium sp.]
MLKAVLLSTAALALLATAADARPALSFSQDNRFVSVMPGGKDHRVPNFAPKISYVYSTIAKNKEGAYFCCYGSTISGPSSTFGHAYGIAEQFTLSAGATVSHLAAGVGYFSGNTGDHKVVLTLYADNGNNQPGTKLAQGTGTTKTVFGFCCGVTQASISSTTLKANTPYWVAITSTGINEEAAGFQVSDEVDNPVYTSSTSDGGNTWGTGYQNTEYNPAIGVY